MLEKKFKILIADDDSRQKVYAEIWYGEALWAEISQEGECPLIAFFSPQNQKYWEFPYLEAMDVLKKAKDKLLR